MQAVLRRSGGARSIYRFGAVEVDLDNYVIRHGAEEERLSNREQELLRYLIEHNGKVLPREELLTSIWRYSPKRHHPDRRHTHPERAQEAPGRRQQSPVHRDDARCRLPVHRHRRLEPDPAAPHASAVAADHVVIGSPGRPARVRHPLLRGPARRIRRRGPAQGGGNLRGTVQAGGTRCGAHPPRRLAGARQDPGHAGRSGRGEGSVRELPPAGDQRPAVSVGHGRLRAWSCACWWYGRPPYASPR